MIELAHGLRLKPVYVLGHLHALWHTALEQQEDGDLSSWSDDLIAEASGYSGDVLQYVSLLQDKGWLDGHLLHDWLDYAGNYLARKYHNSNRRKLIEIWAKYGKRYGNSTSSRKNKGPPNPGRVRLGKVKSESEKEGKFEGGNGLPPWLDAGLWAAFAEMRKKKRAPLTSRAQELLLRDLEKWRQERHDPNAIVEQSIKRGWQGLFLVKDFNANSGYPTKADMLREKTKEALNRPLPEVGKK